MLGRRLGKSCSLPLPLAMASGLFSAAFLAVGGGSVSLTGMPGPPVRRGFSDKSGCNNEPGAKVAGTSVRSL